MLTSRIAGLTRYPHHRAGKKDNGEAGVHMLLRMGYALMRRNLRYVLDY